LQSLPPASAAELVVLKSVGAAPNVRLACQLRPTHDLSVVPLLPVTATARDGYTRPDYIAGQEREICVMFADLRDFTRFSERKLPYDVVFFLNRYLETMSRAVEHAGGIPNQFTGDGVMALFGVESGPEQGSRDAIVAAEAMMRGLAEMSAGLAEELSEPLRMGIGIHTGHAVVGRMGSGVAMYLTAVGDTVHVASRLQDLTKQYQCQLIISEPAARRAGIDVSAFPRYELTVRNRTEPIAIRTIESIEALMIAPLRATAA
jgi:adenylate cyclase